MSWYRNYRPQTVTGLHITSVREAYERILDDGSFSHSYLLTGPKGTGKTSGARILAKVLNCVKNRPVVEQVLSQNSKLQNPKSKKLQEPCNICASCIAITTGTSLSVTEMDAASNRGIDDIRALRERISLVPADGLISVTIIDEVHMLTMEAFNALLKVLEEPPRHVVFILATTDLQKVPATILSRCTQILYRKANTAEISAALLGILDQEKIEADTAQIAQIAASSDGSLRDAVKFLEQIASGKKKISEKDVETILGGAVDKLVSDLLNALLKYSNDKVLGIFTQIEERQIDGVNFQKRTLLRVHERLIQYVDENNPQFHALVKLLGALCVPIEPLLPLSWLPFEIACLEWSMQEAQGSQVTSPQAAIKNTPARVEKEVVEKKFETKKTLAQSEISIQIKEVLQKWGEILAAVKKKSVPVEGLLRAVRPIEMRDAVLVCESSYQFHKEQLELARNRDVVELILEETFGERLRIEFILNQSGQAALVSPHSNITGDVKEDSLVSAAEEAFL